MTGISGSMSMVTHPDATRAATSEWPATSSRVANQWVRLPTLQLPWSAATVENVRSSALVQNTHPAGTRPVRPSGVGSGIGASNGATPSGTDWEKVMAIGGVMRLSAWVSASAASDHGEGVGMATVFPKAQIGRAACREKGEVSLFSLPL